jgi:ADP-heptose:LPS heptosyltransferase
VGGGFEAQAVMALLRRGWRVTLDRGFGQDEAVRAEAIAAAAEREGLRAGLELWQGSAGELAARIAASDLYVGYDSAGGHIASALGVRGIDVFAGAACQRMLQRWSPPGAEVLAVEPGEAPERVLARLEGLLG